MQTMEWTIAVRGEINSNGVFYGQYLGQADIGGMKLQDLRERLLKGVYISNNEDMPEGIYEGRLTILAEETGDAQYLFKPIGNTHPWPSDYEKDFLSIVSMTTPGEPSIDGIIDYINKLTRRCEEMENKNKYPNDVLDGEDPGLFEGPGGRSNDFNPGLVDPNSADASNPTSPTPSIPQTDSDMIKKLMEKTRRR